MGGVYWHILIFLALVGSCFNQTFSNNLPEPNNISEIHQDSVPVVIHPPPNLSPDGLSSYVSTAFDELKFGQLQYLYSGEMTLGETYPFKVLLSADLTTQLLETLEEYEIASLDTIRISPIMAVHLYGNNFNVIPSEPFEQVVDSSSTEWLFDVKPISTGTQVLSLVVYATIDLPNHKEKRKLVESTRKEIDVSVTFFQWVGNLFSSTWSIIIGLCSVVSAIIMITLNWDKLKKKWLAFSKRF